jgi:hypothetical protein
MVERHRRYCETVTRGRHTTERESGPNKHFFSVSETASECSESVIIEVSSTDSSVNRTIKGSVRQLAGKSLTLLLDEGIAVAAAVRVQSKDFLFLRQVLRSISDPPSKWTSSHRCQTYIRGSLVAR